MAYVSLYRKHRPRTFEQVVGQEHVTRTLANAITEDRLHHAYLFTGQRGTGKTSTARILAAAVNCESGPTTEPCGECEQCTSIIAGRNVDVIELDMASHGGVDDARELRDRAVFAPASARKKVYILDEVHMASTAAFNALLKVVEEPPSHVLFAMATTDPQKVLPTIMSRVQRLDLRRIPAPVLTDHLTRIGEEEGFTLDEEAAAGVVAAGDGSARDTMSVLEQVLAFASDAEARDDDGVLHVKGDHVTRVLGATPFELTAGVVDAIADRDVAAALTRIQRLLDGGHDLRRFTLDLARHLRDLLVLAAAPGVEGLVDATSERRDRLAAQAQRFGTDTLVRAVELVGEVLVEQRQGPPRLPLELAVARLATPGSDGDVLALADRIARLEKAVADGGTVPAPPAPSPEPAVTPTPQPEPTPEPAPEPEPEPEPAPQPEPTPQPEPAPTPDPEPQPDPAPQAAEPEPSPEPEPQGTPEPATATASTPEAEPEPADAAEPAPEPTPEPAPTTSSTPAAGSDQAPTQGAASDEASATPNATQAAEDDPRELAGRAAALADSSADRPEPTPLEDRPGTTSVERDIPAAAPGGNDDLSRIAAAWDGIIEAVGDRSRRAKAFYEPATPVRLSNGVLMLSYPADKRFHAEQGKSGEMTAHLAACVEQSTGLERIKVDVQLDNDGPRRPTPPPAAGGSDDGPSPAEVAAVKEVESVAQPTEVDPEQVEELLKTELGAQRLDDDDL